MPMLSLVCLVFALVLFVLAAFLAVPAESPWRSRLVCIGLACWVLADLLTRTLH